MMSNLPGKGRPMEDRRTYQIKVHGQIDEDDLNAISPFRIRLVSARETATRFTVQTDQSGLIGLLRHLHGRGLIILSISCKPGSTSSIE
jgi:hypothetical protein